jgi:hypothetical protein
LGRSLASPRDAAQKRTFSRRKEGRARMQAGQRRVARLLRRAPGGGGPSPPPVGHFPRVCALRARPGGPVLASGPPNAFRRIPALWGPWRWRGSGPARRGGRHQRVGTRPTPARGRSHHAGRLCAAREARSTRGRRGNAPWARPVPWGRRADSADFLCGRLKFWGSDDGVSLHDSNGCDELCFCVFVILDHAPDGSNAFGLHQTSTKANVANSQPHATTRLASESTLACPRRSRLRVTNTVVNPIQTD